MLFLIDANLPRAITDLLRRRGFEALDVRDIGLGTEDDGVIAAYAQKHQYCILTSDFDFADIRNYPPEKYFGIVILERVQHATIHDICKAAAYLLEDDILLENLKGRLAIISQTRTRVRPPLD